MKVTGANVAEALRGPVGWIVVGVVVIGAAYWLFGKAKQSISDEIDSLKKSAGAAVDAIEAPFKAGFQAASDGAAAYSDSLNANAGATGDPLTDSLAVGAAGGG